jgi:hypothetical protein
LALVIDEAESFEEEGMISRRIGCALVGLAALVMIGPLQGDEPKASSRGHCVLNALAQKLGLSDEQIKQVRHLHDAYDKKSEPLREEISKLRHEQHQAIKEVLTEQQRAEMPTVMHAEVKKALQEVASKLGLSEEQQQKAQKIAKEYQAKCDEVMKEKTPDHARMHALKIEGFEAFCGVLTDEQRVKLPGVLKEEMEIWHTPNAQGNLRSDIADRLQLSADQRKSIEKICSEFGPKIEKKKEQFRQIWKDEHAAVEKVLTEAQRTQFRELLKTSADQKK